ncbi:TetR/AcrR family transcriptional regulator [Streptomyces coffeae]|uniref:TetR family transcriptional regulator n=1 Tax=Streptomyces coffeae TaxID=621382 RepID=A0ABS1NCQ7_9ACTN|nr:TetR/AcrR family transcriptional regulator [Streptomyces coffeae]MBL1097690.1 TetR family transcriptional regulator [Streptomyces coffeae]
MSDTSSSSRAQRRARTRTAILEAARQEFAQRGYQKATIRAVAERAGCDPSLVMQHFGNKQGLFRAASELDLDMAAVSAGPAEELSERLIRAVFEQMDARPEATASTFRSMLTHDESAEEALELFNLGEMAQNVYAGRLPDDELTELRGRLLGALTLGTAITRYVLKFSAVEQASIDDLVACLRPAVEVLLRGQNGDAAAR